MSIAGIEIEPNLRRLPAGMQDKLGLTDRQMQVAILIAQCRTAKEIAQILRVSHRTVEIFTAQLKGRLGLDSITAVALRVDRMLRDAEWRERQRRWRRLASWHRPISSRHPV